ncbi:glycoside hydrolase family 3 protein [Mobilicoccus pelagius]|uniref:beta-N-acetylhexosaminidase n=1 Tax=Mobilicoccus pelagius NBRC 104925 TaxID=1089455 RepID=H5UMF6_9MICO|nr:glycoside hydrolase family 3 protein [Mobilicoccus pelagius]GAB46914.1 beta-hexosaminidase [Mobilicoccus pelagius NBRC 104925]
MPQIDRRAVLQGLALGSAALPFAAAPDAAVAATTGHRPTPPPVSDEVTLPGSAPRHRAWARRVLRRMTVEEKVGQLFTCYVHGASATDVTDEEAAKNLTMFGVRTGAEAVAKYHLGGILYFAWSNNVNDPRQIARLSNGLQKAALAARVPVPLTISVDQEQGVVTRIGPPATLFPGAMALGATRNSGDAMAAGRVTAAELRAMGVTMDFAPDADVNVNPANPIIGVRSAGSDPSLVSAVVKAQVAGLQAPHGVSAAIKHFPGHGDTAVDSHVGLPTITHDLDEWTRVDLPPFAAGIHAGVDVVMSGHLVVPALDASGDPATLSRPILTGLLRERLGFRGLVATDGLMMAGVRQKYGDDEVAVRAILAGADMLVQSPDVPTAYTAVLEAVRAGRIPMRRLDESVLRHLQLKAVRGVVARPIVDEAAVGRIVGRPDHRRIAARVSDDSTTLLRNEGVLPARVRGRRIALVGWSSGETTHDVLESALRVRGATVTRATTGATPTPAQIEAAVGATRLADAVLVTTYNVAADSPQMRLVEALRATGRPIVVAAVRNPYDIAHLPQVDAYLATYSWVPVALESLVRTLVGENDPRGRLPVDIPAADGSVLFRRGSGLGYRGPASTSRGR